MHAVKTLLRLMFGAKPAICRCIDPLKRYIMPDGTCSKCCKPVLKVHVSRVAW